MSTEQKITNDIKIPNKDLEILKLHFPQYFNKDGTFQFNKFQNYLIEKDINISTESYGLNWLGKSYAHLLASDPATTLLKADEAHNSKPGNANAKNVLIKGDNLEVLKHLTGAYYEKVKMIYIDPPYNTGSDGFVYTDDRKFTVKQLQDLISIDEEKANRILAFTQSKSNSHSAWLTFMYPRLYIAKQLLRDDGVIFVSIDDNEVAQLRLLLDEVFGEENFRNQIAVRRGAKSVQAQFENIDKLGIGFEHILLYTKNSNFKLPQFYFDLEESKIGSWNNHWRGTDRPSMRYEILGCNIDKGQWRWSKERSLKAVDNYQRLTEELQTNNPTNEQIDLWYTNKKIENENLDLLRISNTGKPEHYVPSTSTKFGNTLWIDLQIGNSNSLKKLELEYFENPKNPEVIKRIVKWITLSDDIILDFFAGSGTTGDAVMQLNAEDGGNRKFILVQLPETIDQKKNKTAYDFVKYDLKVAEPTIFEITKERLLRAAKKVNMQIDKKIQTLKNELPTEETKIEIRNLEEQKTQNTFKIFETTPIWENYNFDTEQFDSAQTLFNTGTLSEEDIHSLLLTWKTNDNIPLTQELQSIDLGGYTAYYAQKKLYLMYKNFTTENLKTVLAKIDKDKVFCPVSIIAFGYHFKSKSLRELSDNVKQCANKKQIDIDFIIRY